MKQMTYRALRNLLSFQLLLAVPCAVNAQDCKGYYYLTNNAEAQMTLYDKNGALFGVQTWKVSNVKKVGTGFTSSVATTMTDAKGALIATTLGSYKCDGGRLMADMRMSMPQEGSKPLTVGESDMDGAFVAYPSGMTVGMSLPDATFQMKTNTSGIASNTTFEMKNRKVTGKEQVTSDAGTWTAFVITYDAVVKLKIGGLGIPMTMKTTEWFVPNFGTVKSQTLNKRGKLAGSALLTKLKK